MEGTERVVSTVDVTMRVANQEEFEAHVDEIVREALERVSDIPLEIEGVVTPQGDGGPAAVPPQEAAEAGPASEEATTPCERVEDACTRALLRLLDSLVDGIPEAEDIFATAKLLEVWSRCFL